MMQYSQQSEQNPSNNMEEMNSLRNIVDMQLNSNKEVAFEYFKKAADQGNLSAITNLGICY